MQFVPVTSTHISTVSRKTEFSDTETTKWNKDRIETIARSYNINVPVGLPPTQKRMTMIIGDQSSGKSSFINYIFGNLEVREVGARAIDAHFTVLEVVDEDEFKELVGVHKYQERMQEHEQLVCDGKRHINQWLYNRESSRDIDTRRNIVWTELEISQVEERYKHLYSESGLKDAFHSVLKAVVVNARFASGTDIEQERAKQFNDRSFRPLCHDIIVIDTPGFNDEINLKKEKLETNVAVLEYFYNRSDIVFCMTSVDHLLSIGNVLYIVEMAMIPVENRKKVIEHMSKGLSLKDALDTVANIAGAASFFYAPLKPVVKGAQAVSYLVTRQQANDRDDSFTHKSNGTYVGPNQFTKLYFLINKIDNCSDNIEQSFFELGCAIGRNFSNTFTTIKSNIFYWLSNGTTSKIASI
jgi:GTP-binding protein EngB required for normal cell division